MKKLALLRLCGIAIISIAFTQSLNAQINVYLGKQAVVPTNWFGYNGATVIREGQPTYDSQWLLDTLSNLSPSTIRYPGGYLSNFWNWQIGHFLQDLPKELVLPKDFYNDNYRDLGYNQIKTMSERIGIVPTRTLNILTSDKYYETASLMHANSLNLPIKYVELGNEFYLDYKENTTIFPTAEDYINTANDWANYIKSRPGFENYKIAVVGSPDKYPYEPRISRRNRWNAIVAANANANVDAVALHWYIMDLNMNNQPVSEQTAPLVLSNVFSNYETLKNELKDISDAGKEAWFTEYNLYDQNNCLHQNYIHGLFTSAMTLIMLQNPGIKLVQCHAMIGTSGWGSIFNDTTGFDLTGLTKEGVNCISAPLPATNAHDFTAQGTCLQLIGSALINAKTKRQLTFTNGPKLPGGYEALMGFQMDGTLSTDMIIMNMDSVDRTINIDANTWNLSQGKYVGVYPGPGGIMDIIKGRAKINPGPMECATTGLLPASQTMILKAYSIYRIFVPKNAIKVKATDNTICSGTTTALQVSGGAGYTWIGPNLTEIKTDKSVMRFTAPVVTAATTYMIKAITPQGYSDSVSIVVNPKPVVSVTSNFNQVCKGSQVTLTAVCSGGNMANKHSLIWTPSSSIVNPDADIALAYPYENTTYRCYATDGICWTSFDSVNVIVRPKADAGSDYSLCDDSLPYTLQARQYDPLLNYKWYSNGVLIGTGVSIPVSPTAATTYTLEVSTNDINGCMDSDEVTLSLIHI